ncbi:MAG: SpoIIE family protein phosphatase [Leptospiraceae bacterium]|nr:SpoIIE family protein phosphatase [Leptospiraceae bacterium]
MPGELQKLQHRLLKKTLRFILIPAVPAFLHLGWQSYENQDLDRFFFLYAPLMAVFCFLVFFDRIPYGVRSSSMVMITALAGLSDLYFFGLASMGFMLGSLAVLIATVFNGFKSGIMVLGLYLALSFCIGYGYDSGFIALRPESPQQTVSVPLNNWITPILFFILAAGGAATMTWTLLSGLSRSLTRLFHREKQLETLNATLESRVAERTRELENLYATTQEELALAARTQQSFLTHNLRPTRGWDLAVLYLPSQTVSGDLYDFYFRDQELLGLSIFDVSGHGVGSGLLTLMARSVARQTFFEMQDAPLEKVMQTVNERLIGELEDVDHHLTGLILRFSDSGRTVDYANAGHPEVLLIRSSGDIREPFKEKGMEEYGTLLGIDSIARPYQSTRFSIHPGESLLCFTDGLLDIQSEQKEELGSAGLEKLLSSLDLKTRASHQMRQLQDALFHYAGREHHSDDVTVLLLCRVEDTEVPGT